jgi:hypothetical protein
VLTKLGWEVKGRSFKPCTLQFHDIAGQDFRRLFSETQPPQRFQAIWDSVRSAEVIVYLVNLGDFIGREDADTRAASELALINALNLASSSANPRRSAIVFTQIDLYDEEKEQFGSWEAVAREFLPTLYREYIQTRRTSLLAVSSVANVVPDGSANRNGLLVPATHWHSIGLEKLVRWMCQSAADVEAEKQQKPRDYIIPQLIIKEPNIDFNKPGCLSVLLPFLLVVFGCCWWSWC